MFEEPPPNTQSRSMGLTSKGADRLNANEPSSFEIYLTEKQEISTIDDIDSIYNSFNLPSWLPEHYRVKITSMSSIQRSMSNTYLRYDVKFQARQDLRQQQKQPEDDQFTFLEQERRVTGIRRKKKKHEHATEQCIAAANIYYQIQPITQGSRPFAINVHFESRYEWEFILIRVEDKDGFFKTIKDSQTPRIPTRWPYRKDELYYPYIEPQNVRTVTKDTPHFHMAFQGGGAKGAAYVGAVEALLENNLGVPIKSIIGSSAGGIIAMALAAGTSSSSLIGYCERMTEIPKDTTARSRDDMPNKEKCDRVLAQLKIAIQQYGLVPADAIPLVERILTPQFIETLLELIGHVMDGIEDTFVFPDDGKEETNDSRALLERGELPRCMPCVDQKRNENRGHNKGNYYGLVQGQLLRGEAVRSLALDILVEYLRKKQTNRGLIENWYPEFRNYNSKQISQANTRIIRSVAESLTMLQFYQLTDVEFTVTSVDIDSKILRFFNHKTTPSLPVHMAVIMTGSFPVAFEARKWESRWGKYYIHYERWRREIDLTGHQFTDGGVLANFPMMYLDNEDMRPMYFSRKCVYDLEEKNSTSIIGFGLEEVEETNPKVDSKRTAQQLFEELKRLAVESLPWCWMFRVGWHYLKSVQNHGTAYDLSQIPIFKFLYKLLRTYMTANDHLVTQCFEMAICFQSPYKSFAERLDIPNQVQDTTKQHQQQLQIKILQLAKLVKEAMDFQTGEGELRTATTTYLATKGKNHCNADDYENVKHRLRRVFVTLHNINVAKKDLLKSANDKTVVASFNLQGLRSADIEGQLSRIQLRIQEGSNILERLENTRSYEPLIGTFQPTSIRPLVDTWNSYPRQEPTCLMMRFQPSLSFDDLVIKWSEFPVRSMFKRVEETMKAVAEQLKRQDISEKLQFHESQEEIRNYINSRLSQENNCKNIHLVFQGRGVHNIFLYRIFKLVEDCIFKLECGLQYQAEKKAAYFIMNEWKPAEKDRKICEMGQDRKIYEMRQDRKIYEMRLALNQQLAFNLEEILRTNQIDLKRLGTIEVEPNKSIHHCLLKLKSQVEGNRLEKQKKEAENRSHQQPNHYQITAITCGSMHSFFGFLLAAGLSTEEVEKQWDFVEKSFTLDFTNSIEQFNRQKWFLTNKFRINQEFQEEIWSERYELFSHLQQQIKKAESMQGPQATEKLLAELEYIQIQFEESKYTILNSYDMILEHVLANKAEFGGNEDFSQKLAQNMSLNVARENYFAKNKKISQETKEFITMIQSYFEEQIRFMLYISSTQTEKNLINNTSLKPEVKKDMWKCMLITRFLTCKQLKKKVREILTRLRLPRDISLKDFYEMAPRKLELTFPAVDLITKKMRFINQRTYPDMPVWAAVAIGSSLPMIFPIFKARHYWCRQIAQESSVRIVKAFFKDDSFSYSPLFVSGNMITNFPLDFLTNHRIRQEFFKQRNYTMLNFGVKDQKTPVDPVENTDLKVQYFRKYLSVCQLLHVGKLGSLSREGMNLKHSVRYNLLTTYMESHDNLVRELYNKELLQLPVRFSTLSFYKFQREGDKVSPVLKTLLDETYLSTLQKFRNGKAEQSYTYICAQVIDKVIIDKETDKEKATDKKKKASSEPQPTKRTLVLQFISKERSNQDFTRKYKIEYRFARKTRSEKTGEEKEVPWMKVVKQRIDVELPTGQVQRMRPPQMVYLRFSYPVQVINKQGPKPEIMEPKPDIREEKFEIKESEFELDVSVLWNLKSDAIFAIDYKRVGIGYLLRSLRFSQTKDMGNEGQISTKRLPSRQMMEERSEDIKLPYRSIVNVEKTGLYCSTCCGTLQHIIGGNSLRRECYKCKKLRGIVFECPDNNAHQDYCLDCCKNYAIQKKGDSLFCEFGHPYIAENSTVLPASNRSMVICDICQFSVDIFFNDHICNLSICTKCCTKLSMLHKSGK